MEVPDPSSKCGIGGDPDAEVLLVEGLGQLDAPRGQGDQHPNWQALQGRTVGIRPGAVKRISQGIVFSDCRTHYILWSKAFRRSGPVDNPVDNPSVGSPEAVWTHPPVVRKGSICPAACRLQRFAATGGKPARARAAVVYLLGFSSRIPRVRSAAPSRPVGPRIFPSFNRVGARAPGPGVP